MIREDVTFPVSLPKEKIILTKECIAIIQSFIDSFSYPIILVDEKHNILLVNDIFQKKLGLEKKQIIGRYCSHLVHGVNNLFRGCPLEKAIAISKNVQREIKYGEKSWLISGVYFSNFYTYEGKRVFICYTVDITKRKLAEEKLIEASEKFELLSKKLEKIYELGKVTVSVQNKLIYIKDKQVLVDTISRELSKFRDYTYCFILRKKDEKLELLNSRPHLTEVEKQELYNFLDKLNRKVKLDQNAIFSARELAVPSTILQRKTPRYIVIIPMFAAQKQFGIMVLLTEREEFFEHEEVILSTIANELGFSIEMLEINEEREKALNQLLQNKKELEELLDQIVNPLTVMKGMSDLKFETNGMYQLFREQIDKIIKKMKKIDKKYKETTKMLKEQDMYNQP
ncbi:MAG: PAS domain S-box protein [Candidatus Heimdallarchaeum aukensis]|uniref:PAS domain S-box protein n=1 Tax=Candidatus Heimdallarchaeum aukensis TaxID=2876573 RepID=A0A9Y1FMG6_9ARCH|nr:MAG: PAS domain S-box protein [Candidatus Heimdallarchaeum aukensis]